MRQIPWDFHENPIPTEKPVFTYIILDSAKTIEVLLFPIVSVNQNHAVLSHLLGP